MQSPTFPAISVALCTFNGERYLGEQLQSILQQSAPLTEIVIGDDGSTDGTLAVIDSIAASSSVPIRVLKHGGLGVAGNFAATIAATTGDVIALSDQDDVWHRDRLTRMVPRLKHVALVHSDARLVDAEGTPLGTSLLEAIEASDWEIERMAHGGALEALLRRNLVTGATTIVRGDFARAALPIPPGWIHDEWLAMLAAIDGGVALIPEATIDYRQHGANAIGVRKLSVRQKFARLVEADSGSHARKAKRASSLATEAAKRGLGTEQIRTMLVEKARHERTRASLPDRRLLRVPAVVRGVLAGRYRCYSRGVLDIARDLAEGH